MFVYPETVNLGSARAARILADSFNSNFKICMRFWK